MKKNLVMEKPGVDCNCFSFCDLDNLLKNGNEALMLVSHRSHSGCALISTNIGIMYVLFLSNYKNGENQKHFQMKLLWLRAI